MSPVAWQEFKGDVLAKFTRTPAPFAKEMLGAYASGGIEAAIAAYEHVKQRFLRSPEADLNDVAYALMSGGHHKDAAAVLEFALREIPDSANLYDSLGEAYMNAGDDEAAARSYRKSLELDPSNDNARQMLTKLGAKP
jgi:cytochrome c-type biogenesis protein CcmH/NrfG